MESSEIHKNKKHSVVSQIDCSGSDLPEDLIPNILVCVPALHLTRFKIVCKPWCSLISQPRFLDSHLNHSRSYHQQHHIILTTGEKEMQTLPTFSLIKSSFFDTTSQPLGYNSRDKNILSINMRDRIDDMRVERLRLNFPLPGLKLSVKASCDGLLLLRDQNGELYVYNPVITTTYKHLPHPGDDPNSRVYNWTLFYHTSIGKYRVCGLHYYKLSSCRLILLTLGDDTWSRTGLRYTLNNPTSPLVFLDKKLHWLTVHPPDRPSQHCILSMEVATSKIHKTDVPVELHKQQRHLLSEVKSSLCLTSFSWDQIEIFILEDGAYGIWARRYKVCLQLLSNLPSSLRSFLSDHVRVAVTRDPDFSGLVKIFLRDKDQLICYDLKHQKSNIIGTLSKEENLREVYQFYSSTFVRV